MNVFVSSVIFVEDEKDKQEINNNLNLYGLSKNVSVGDCYKQDTDNYIIANEKIYVVKPMDTITKIATKLNIPEQKVKELVNSKMVFVGQKIVY